MKIAFWSNANEKCGVSANLAAISVASVIRYPYSLLILENHLTKNNLGQAYLGKPNVDMIREVGTNYYEGGGMEGLLRKIYRDDYRDDTLPTYIKEIIHKHLYYIPQSRETHNEIFDYELNHCIHPLLNRVEKYVDITFIDTACHHNLSSKTILEEADLIVVNLCQNPSVLEDFILNYSSLMQKAVFLIGKYTGHSQMSCKRISKMYKIPWENISVIPFNEMFHIAIRNGRVKEFISVNYSCKRDNPNFLFIQSVKKASSIIMKKIEYISDLNSEMVGYHR